MSPMGFNIEVLGEKAIHRQFLRFAERASDPTPALEEIASLFYESEKKQFDSEGGWASGGWAPLQQETIDRKNRLGLLPQILQATGALMSSLTQKDSQFATTKLSPNELTIISKQTYGIYHQQPDGPTNGNLPMRKPVELPESVKREMEKVLQAWIVGDQHLGSLLT
jgi:hypothetical protein